MVKYDFSDFDTDTSKYDFSDLEPKISNTESSLRGAAQGGTFNFADEIEAGAVLGFDAFKNVITNNNNKKFKDGVTYDLYLDYLDEARNRYKEAQKENPNSYFGGEMAGSFGTSFIPGLNAVKGASALKRGLYGAGQGAANALGSSEGGNVSDNLWNSVQGALVGGGLGYGTAKLGDKLFKKIDPVAEKYVDFIEPTMVKKNKDEIINAASRMGINVTPGMLDDAGYMERLEYTLAQSPSYFGRRIAKRQKNVSEGLKDAVKVATKEADGLDSSVTGDNFKSSITQRIGQEIDPISAVFSEVTESTRHIPVSEKAKKVITSNIEKMDNYELTGGAGKPSQYVEMIKRAKNANQIKTLMTMLNGDIKAAEGAEKQILIGIKDKMKKLEENSIMRAAIEFSKETGMNPDSAKNIGKNIVEDLLDARKAYQKYSNKINETALDAKIKNYGPSSVIDQIENIPSEQIQKRFFNTNNLRQLSNLKNNFPEEFELLRKGELQKILNKSVDNTMQGQGNVSTQRFLTEIRKLNKDVKELIFNNPELLNDIDIVQKSIPRNFNPSGTAGTLGWNDMIFSNAADFPKALIYKAGSTKIGNNTFNKLGKAYDEFGDKFVNFGSKFKPALINYFTKEKNNDTNPEWLLNGANALFANDENFDPLEYSEVFTTRKGKNLLLEADMFKDNPTKLEEIKIKMNNLKDGVK